MKKIAGDITILHKCTKNHNHKRVASWDTEWGKQNFLLIWAIFLGQKNQNFETKKNPGDIIILQLCTIYENHMMYGSWDMKHATDRMFCHFGPFSALLPLYIVCIRVSTPLKNAIPLFLAKPPLNQQTVQAPLFR